VQKTVTENTKCLGEILFTVTVSLLLHEAVGGRVERPK